ncbi:MAG: UvrD-helicase domain-containing protein, partial [Deltaproteobacteria bacterium]|nr:UvrD-helicase domain-containing protein [Deltaproteobacteria bacterium]
MPGFPLQRIRASAGSGKTYALTSRFVTLLAGSENGRKGWQGILAATFTNSAAAEMRDRILSRLKEVALKKSSECVRGDAPLTPDLALERLDDILRYIGSLNVSTIDSLLSRIVRMGALELGLSPDFEPVFDNRECLGPLWETLMEDMQDDPETGFLLRKACKELLFHNSQFRGFLAGDLLRSKTLDLAALMLEQGISRHALDDGLDQ